MGRHGKLRKLGGKARKMAVILKQNGDHWPPFSASVRI
ncbi:hypothetical protein PDR5_11340 [Pseudomonas sp. DR 5-09]|nr:hypothetical protein PDR5_11340 [Pseudomonas sp. DR 5-09]